MSVCTSVCVCVLKDVHVCLIKMYELGSNFFSMNLLSDKYAFSYTDWLSCKAVLALCKKHIQIHTQTGNSVMMAVPGAGLFGCLEQFSSLVLRSQDPISNYIISSQDKCCIFIYLLKNIYSALNSMSISVIEPHFCTFSNILWSGISDWIYLIQVFSYEIYGNHPDIAALEAWNCPFLFYSL